MIVKFVQDVMEKDACSLEIACDKCYRSVNEYNEALELVKDEG